MISHLELYCTSKFEIGLIGSLIFVGFMLGCLVLPSYADTHGRRPLFLGLVGFQLIVWLLMILVTDLKLFYVLVFLFGVCVTGRFTIGFILYQETLPKYCQAKMAITMNICDGAGVIFSTFYFAFLSKNWMILQLMAIALNFVGLVANCIFRQESPRFLMTQGRIDEVLTNLKVQASYNDRLLEFNDYLMKHSALIEERKKLVAMLKEDGVGALKAEESVINTETFYQALKRDR